SPRDAVAWKNGDHHERNGDFLVGGSGFGLGNCGPRSQRERNSKFRIGAKGAHAGVNGSLHSSANARVNAKNRSSNGIYNSTVGSKGAATGQNGGCRYV